MHQLEQASEGSATSEQVTVAKAAPAETPEREPGVGEPEQLPPVVILGGDANALSVARELARLGVTVFVIGEKESSVRYSRFCRWVQVPLHGGTESVEEAWARFLLGPESDFLQDAVVLACSDAGIQVLARHREQLLKRFRLDLSDPVAQVAMLDKLTTYEHALSAGVPTPRFWKAATRRQVLALEGSLVFPLIVKPRLSHVFEKQFGRKHVTASNFGEVLAACDAATGADVDVLLVEWIPGPDSLLCSYYTYLDEHGKPLFHFTKRVIRRYPTGMGGACYHVTDWIPELIEPANRLFRHAGLRGLANVEFKRDERDGQYKLIECNARFTAADALVCATGFNLAAFVYNRIVGRPLPRMEAVQFGMRLWDPLRDFASFLELRRDGRITLLGWLCSIMHRQTFPYFSWTDPAPTVARLFKGVVGRLPRMGRSI